MLFMPMGIARAGRAECGVISQTVGTHDHLTMLTCSLYLMCVSASGGLQGL